MASDRKAAASRRNGAKSGGPRTAAGRARSSRNAVRHGLSTISIRNQRYATEIQQIVDRICCGKTHPLLVEWAVVFAESEYLLRCIQSERIAIIERLRDPSMQPLVLGDNSLAVAEARLELSKLAYAELARIRPSVVQKGYLDGYFSDNVATSPDAAERDQKAGSSPAGTGQAAAPSDPLASLPETVRTEEAAFALALPDLARLDRYERRAWSRRKRAVREIIRIRIDDMHTS